MVYSVQARFNMIKNQLEPAGVSDELLLNTLASIPRESFLPEALAANAYLDEDIPLNEERYLVEPRVIAKMLQAAEIKKGEKILDIACGTGYSAAIMAELGGQVVAVESDGELAELARRNLRELKSKVELFSTSLSGGYALKAQYDLIFINGSIELLSDDIAEQCAEGGRILAVKAHEANGGIGVANLGTVTRWNKIDGQWHETKLFDASVPLLSDFRKKPQFQF
jgi:protein-L-isoaspartate(D-aspartate) O-methyltransferase